MREEEYTIPQMVDEVRAGKMPRRQFMKKLAHMGITAAGIGAIAAVASIPTASGPITSAPVIEDGTDHLQLHDQHLQNQTSGNTGALQNDYHENAIVEDSMYPQPFVGRAAIMARKGTGMAAIPDLQIQVVNRVVHGNQVSVEWIATGTHSGDFPGLPASGRSFSIQGVTVVVRENGKITRESLYYDMAEVRRQLGRFNP
ncbi:MAG TPA: ester cyclase [Ktedonobacteraceae bacterium]|nr:ester cyclase [Ktedonobacteraceae bacterium]